MIRKPIKPSTAIMGSKLSPTNVAKTTPLRIITPTLPGHHERYRTRSLSVDHNRRGPLGWCESHMSP